MDGEVPVGASTIGTIATSILISVLAVIVIGGALIVAWPIFLIVAAVVAVSKGIEGLTAGKGA